MVLFGCKLIHCIISFFSLNLWRIEFSIDCLPSGIGFFPRKKFKITVVILYNGSIPFGLLMAVLLYRIFSFHVEKFASRNWIMRVFSAEVDSDWDASAVDESAPINTTKMSTMCNGTIFNCSFAIFCVKFTWIRRVFLFLFLLKF